MLRTRPNTPACPPPPPLLPPALAPQQTDARQKTFAEKHATQRRGGNPRSDAAGAAARRWPLTDILEVALGVRKVINVPEFVIPLIRVVCTRMAHAVWRLGRVAELGICGPAIGRDPDRHRDPRALAQGTGVGAQVTPTVFGLLVAEICGRDDEAGEAETGMSITHDHAPRARASAPPERCRELRTFALAVTSKYSS